MFCYTEIGIYFVKAKKQGIIYEYVIPMCLHETDEGTIPSPFSKVRKDYLSFLRTRA
jgi:hypothetical protein